MRAFAYLTLALFIPGFAYGGDCGWNADKTHYSCGPGYGGADTGASSPTLSDALETVPASLPTVPTPIGLETRYSSRSAKQGSPAFSFTTLKGFSGLGAALGSWADGTFSAPDYSAHFVGTPSEALFQATQASPASGLRGGLSLAAPGFFIPKGLTLKAGFSAGSGHVAGHMDPQISAEAGVSGFAIGYTHGTELLSTMLPQLTTSSVSVGLRINKIYAGFTADSLTGGGQPSTSSSTITLRWTGSVFTSWVSAKFEIDQLGRPSTWTQLGLRSALSKHVSFYYLYGEYRYSHSAGLQLYIGGTGPKAAAEPASPQ